MALTCSCEERHMDKRTLTTASFGFSFGWARFMGAGFFGMGKNGG